MALFFPKISGMTLHLGPFSILFGRRGLLCARGKLIGDQAEIINRPRKEKRKGGMAQGRF
jgi:hypothetical protein